MRTETQSLPLVIGAADQFSKLRSALDRAGYTESAICQRTGIESIFEFRTIREGRKTGLEMNDGLDALIRLLMDEEILSAAELRRFFPSETLDCLAGLGVVEEVGDRGADCYATVVLYPVAGLYVASDRTFLPGAIEPRELPADAVYAAITGNTGRFVSFLPQDPCEDFLDLCAGTGIGALVAGARFAKRAWAADLGHRCVHFAEFNRRLNGLEWVTSVQGDLYEAVGDRRFDRIVAHPPYVPNRDRELLFRDGGEDGEQILARIIQGLPKYLRPGGSFYCITAATDRENEALEQRIRRWLGETQSEFDVLLLAIEFQRAPDAILEAVVKSKGRLGELGPTSQLFRRLKVTGTFYGAVVVQRRAEQRGVVTARAIKGRSAGAEALEWFRRWETAAAGPEFPGFLYGSRPRMSRHMKLLVTHTPQDGGLLPSEFLLRSAYPFHSEARIEPWVAALIGSCNGNFTTREIYQELKRQDAISAEMGEAELAGVLRLLISAGFLDLPDFALPERS
jgi:methylase of polypeptide subunit release factors